VKFDLEILLCLRYHADIRDRRAFGHRRNVTTHCPRVADGERSPILRSSKTKGSAKEKRAINPNPDTVLASPSFCARARQRQQPMNAKN
jgi:hypothetical protein